MARPDRRPVPDALDIVPHPVAVDPPCAGGLGDADHPAVDMLGHAGDHVPGRFPQALRPVLPDQIVIAADAAGGDDHGLRAKAEVAGDFSRAASSALDVIALEARPADAVAAAPKSSHAVAARAPPPVPQCELVVVLDAEPAVFGVTDQKQPAERPEGLAAELLFARLTAHVDPLPAAADSLPGDEARQPAAD